jgi:hypothetical protein
MNDHGVVAPRPKGIGQSVESIDPVRTVDSLFDLRAGNPVHGSPASRLTADETNQKAED